MHPGWPITSLQKRSVATPFYFCGSPSRAESHYDSLAIPLGTYRGLGQYIEMCLSFILFCMLDLSIFHFFVIYLWHSFIYVLIIVVSVYGPVYECGW